MSSFTNPLDSIKVASPCSADWDAMVGNERQRFCGQCKLNVYNLSAMTRNEAENLIMNAEGRVCARFYRRQDGTILTQDCPVGWAAVKKRMSRVWTAVASMLITLFSGIGIVAVYNRLGLEEDSAIAGEIVVERPIPITKGPEQVEQEPILVMGDVAEEPDMTIGKIAVPESEIVLQGEVSNSNVSR